MKNILVFLFVFFALSFTSCKKPQQSLTIKEGILSVGIEIGYPPMEYYDTDGVTPIGFDIELTQAIAERLGLEINYIDTAWEGILAGLDANRYDIAVNITILPARQERYNFTKPYIDSSMTIVALKNSPINIEKPEDITGYRVGYQSDTTAQYFTERLRDRDIIFTSFSYDKITNCFDDLRLRRVDLVVVDNIVAFYFAGKEDAVFDVVWQGASDEFIGIALKKGNETLTEALNKTLDDLFEDGTIAEISRRILKRDVYENNK